jgi:hypothetical protein
MHEEKNKNMHSTHKKWIYIYMHRPMKKVLKKTKIMFKVI